jgi:hypothetical protein
MYVIHSVLQVHLFLTVVLIFLNFLIYIYVYAETLKVNFSLTFFLLSSVFFFV